MEGEMTSSLVVKWHLMRIGWTKRRSNQKRWTALNRKQTRGEQCGRSYHDMCFRIALISTSTLIWPMWRLALRSQTPNKEDIIWILMHPYFNGFECVQTFRRKLLQHIETSITLMELSAEHYATEANISLHLRHRIMPQQKRHTYTCIKSHCSSIAS